MTVIEAERPIETEDGPDPNGIRRHAKKMLTEFEYRRNYRRIDFYKPNDKQREFHNTLVPEVMLRAGNQLGKTHAAGAQMTMDALAMYPGWYEGRRFLVPPKIERPIDFMGWAACTTAEKTRDGAQLKLLGPVREQGMLGTGLIPLDNIGRITMSRGVSDCVDTVSLTRDNGGKAMIRFKSYAEGREVFQGEPVDVPWLDEDVSRDDSSIYDEVLARLTTTRGRIICSLTPLLGLSPLRKRFKQRVGTGECVEILMTIYDCAVSKGGHIPDEEIPAIIARYGDKADTRAFGADSQGEGAVFSTPRARITHDLDPAAVPPYWPWLWGVDFRHSGSINTGHPFAAVLCCWDRDADCIYVMHAIRMLGLAANHVAAMKQHPRWQAPVAWPHDGGKGGSIISGDSIAKTYAKLGLNMRPTHATFPTGGFQFENGIDEMQNRFAGERLKVAGHLSNVFDEYLGYHRIDGLVNKVDDDLLSAIRQVVMDIRFAKAPADFRALARPGNHNFAQGTLGHPNGSFDIFTGAA
jgi:phage terminase large subunit-like protein